MATLVPVPSDPSIQELLREAAEKTGKYEWMDAAATYQRAIDSTSGKSTVPETARLTELLARCYFKGAFQSERREEFKRRMQLAETGYERARTLYEEAGSEAPAKRSNARGLFANFWLKDHPEDRRNIIGRSISMAEDAAKLFERQGDRNGIGETDRDILRYLFEAWWLAREWSVLKEVFDKAFRYGETAVAELEATGDTESLLESLHALVLFLSSFEEVVEPARYREKAKKAETLTMRMTDISAKIRTPFALSLAGHAASIKAQDVEGDYLKALDISETAITAAKETRDSYLIAMLAMNHVYAARNAGMAEEDAERRRDILQRGIRLSLIATNNSQIFSHGGQISTALEGEEDCYFALARFVETEPEKKRALLIKAVEIARRGYSYKEYRPSSGHALIKSMYFLSIADIDPLEKAKLLEEALPLGEEAVRAADLLYHHSWYQGVDRNYLALIKAELAKNCQDSEMKFDLLQGAVNDMQQCVELCSEWAIYPGNMLALSLYEEWYGDILLQLYESTRETGTIQRAIKVFEDAIGYLRKLEHLGPIGSIDWKIAKIYDTIGDYKQASHAFRRAAEDYRLGAKKIPGSATVFGELESYMESWSLIEEARLHHGEEQYLLAAEDYTKAASTLQHTKTWAQLSKHYAACSFLEGGEALSRQERQEAAVESFSEAVRTFRSAKSEIDNRLREILGSQEKQELNTWRKVTDGRERLCQGRILLEEAKILDRKGEEEASAAKYGSAFEVFRELMAEAETEQSRRELETLSLFSQAWAKMKEAETRASPDLYAGAAESFTRVERVATRKRFRLQALANASICRSLEAGTQFRRTRNIQLYSEIKKELETATDYYQEAGLQNAADWTRATGKLFDALVYLADAATERESKKKTELFHLAEKHLQLAAKLYEQAGFPVKKNEALKHLERAREEKELLLTPVEALAENPALTGSTATPVSLIRDQALGLDRFEAANVVGNLSLHQKELGVGSELTLELEMANVGKTAATLMKLENIAPDGFELDRQMIQYRIEDNFVDMKGKRLEYLKTHEVKIPMKAMRKGVFELRPRILFVDEKGTYRSYEFQPAAVTVRELGISGWLKGPSK